jgi:hypothetical protein
MDFLTISKQTARRYVLGKQGLWPGRRWAGKGGTAQALREIEALQLDPLNVVSRSHDIALWGRVWDYHPEHLDQVVYQERGFFDYGSLLFLYPIAELPFWRLQMQRRQHNGYWSGYAQDHLDLLKEVRRELHQRGPLSNRDFDGNQRVSSYRGRKDTSVALYYLWITGAVMIHHRQRFERVYDLCERIAPPGLDFAASPEQAEDYFAHKAVSFMGLIRERRWATSLSEAIYRKLGREEAQQWLKLLVEQGDFTPLRIEGSKDTWYVLSSDLPVLAALESGEIPAAWQPVGKTTLEEATFLAPLDIVSTRGRANWLFDFEYIWEVYKPAALRRWGYYTLPILYGDRLVARLDPKLDRASATLTINGFWLEDHVPATDPAFVRALAAGLLSFARYLRAGRLHIGAIAPAALRQQVRNEIGDALQVEDS